MALNCEHCGCKSNEVKSGSGVEPKGKKITLRITDPSDLNRDILKVNSREIELSLADNHQKMERLI